MELRVSSRRIFRPLLALLLISGTGFLGKAFATSPEPAPDTMEARVMACAACHGKLGEGTSNDYFPRLAGKPADYLYNQLVNFRSAHRRYPAMNYLVTYLSDDYLHEIATYFSKQRPPYPKPEVPKLPAAEIARGGQIVRNGDPSRNLPACIACHGARLTGTLPAIPGLVGLHPEYISAQLGAWRSGVRRAKDPDCMHEVATRLNDADINAVAAWLSTQTAPQDAAPAPAGSSKMPLSCGSQPQ
jgi:cytochrome c553